MLAPFTVTALLASTALLALADVTPSVPGPGIIYRTGETCHIEWESDKESTTAWNDMAIQLMTGDNFQMIHLTTVATGLDGTVDGTFDHPCPAVIPNSAIYFYQFTAPGSPNKQWATRFTIASSTGATIPPANPTQPGTDAAIPWGTGALADPASAVPPPASAGGSDTPPSGATGASTTPSSTTVTPSGLPGVSTAGTGTETSKIATTATASGISAPTAFNETSNIANGTTNNQTKENAAVTVDVRMWSMAGMLSLAAMALAVVL